MQFFQFSFFFWTSWNYNDDSLEILIKCSHNTVFIDKTMKRWKPNTFIMTYIEAQFQLLHLFSYWPLEKYVRTIFIKTFFREIWIISLKVNLILKGSYTLTGRTTYTQIGLKFEFFNLNVTKCEMPRPS